MERGSWRPLLSVAALCWLAGCSPHDRPALPVVKDFRVNNYLGTWHEIATIPARFQRKCTGPATAVYESLGDRIAVTNTCPTRHGQKVAHARARFTGPATEGRLEVTFVHLGKWWLWPAAGRYWIIALDPDYQWSVVGEPGRDYAWILARRPSLPRKTLARLRAVLEDAGYDSCALVVTSASQAPDRPRLCDLPD